MMHSDVSSDSSFSLDPAFTHSEDRFKDFVKQLRGRQQWDQQQLPGLADLLDDYVNPDVPVSNEQYIRRLLRVFKDSVTDDTYSSILAKYDEPEQARIKAFVGGESIAEAGREFQMGLSLGAREELGRLRAFSHSLFDHLADHIKAAIVTAFGDFHIYNDAEHKHKVDIYVDEEFENWGHTVQNKPKFTCVPQTAHGVQEIVRYAKKNNMNVRAAGYRHSWSPIFGKNGQILISTIDLPRAEVLPNFESLKPQWYAPDSDLSSISIIGGEPQPHEKRLVRVGTAVTNSSFRVWCTEQKIESHLSTLPFNAILVEVTLGGSNATICHGAGRAHSTLSDLVYAIEYVDADGNLQSIDRSNPRFLAAASGCFGLLGVVTHITLEVDPMSYAVLTPQKLPVMKAIPPPADMDINDIPEPLRVQMTAAERVAALAEFEKHVRDDFYSEWFWFPYTSQVWVNCWNTVDDASGAVEYPSQVDVFFQFLQTIAVQILQVSEAIIHLEQLLPLVQTTLISKLGLDVMPDILTHPKDNIKTKLPNALHFRRAVQNVRVRDMELEIPLLPRTGSLETAKFDDPVDLGHVQRAFWSAILTCYKHTDTCPQRMPLEMRITGPSSVTLAPFRGHNMGTCSIEVLTLAQAVPDQVWRPYAQEILDGWMSLTTPQGQSLAGLTRPHWAKEWVDLDFSPLQEGERGKKESMISYVKRAYKIQTREFRQILKEIVETNGNNWDEVRTRFGNDLLDRVLFDHDDEDTEGVKRGEVVEIDTTTTFGAVAVAVRTGNGHGHGGKVDGVAMAKSPVTTTTTTTAAAAVDEVH